MGSDLDYLRQAVGLSSQSVAAGGFPIGAVIVKDSQVISTGISNGEQLHDPTSHAETAAIRAACDKLSTRHLDGATLYSSLEPCLMCFAASDWARIGRIVYACDTKLFPRYDETDIDIHEVAPRAHFPVEIIHLAELESQASKIIADYQAAIET